MEHQVCPHCGYDLVADAPVLINDFSMNGPGFPLAFRGKPLKLTYNEATVCWSLMKVCPAPMKTSVLAERIGSDEGKDPDGIIKVMICRIRKILRTHGLPVPIVTITRGHAYAWDPTIS